jgi:fermentation-respiration switch protein FrsA (DUF1100 family)
MLSSVITTLVTVWALLAVVLYLFQPYFVYFPEARLGATPKQVGLAYESVSLFTEDGIKLHGWFIPHSEARGTLLFFHGNGGNIAHRMYFLRNLHGLRLNIFIFDYRGYGQSEGDRPTEEGTYRDAQAAWRYLTEERGIAPERIVFFGESLGAAIATWLAGHHQPGGLILMSAFTSMQDMARRYYPFWSLPFLLRYKYPTLDRIARIRRPILIAHSPQDEIVPFAHGQQLFAAAQAPKTFFEMRGDHNNGILVSGKAFDAALDRFISGVLGE